MRNDFWLPIGLVTVQRASAFPAGSLLLFSPNSSKRETIAPAIRFDVTNDDGSTGPCILWLQGGRAPDPLKRTVSRCQDWHLDADPVVGAADLKLLVEIDGTQNPAPGHSLSWRDSNGCIAAGTFGLRIVGLDHDAYAIDPKKWQADFGAAEHRAATWFPDWRIRVVHGDETITIIPFQMVWPS